MFGIYTIVDVLRLLATAVFATGVYVFVIRPMREYAKDCENFRKFIEEEVPANAEPLSFFAFFTPLIMGNQA